MANIADATGKPFGLLNKGLENVPPPLVGDMAVRAKRGLLGQ